MIKQISDRMVIADTKANISELLRHKGTSFYLEDAEVEIAVYSNQVRICYIENAQKVGKFCKIYCYEAGTSYELGSSDLLCKICNDHGNDISTLLAVLEAGCMPDVQVYTSEVKGVKVFSPFIKQKPIKVPAKWTKAHLVKAILSGQITSGSCAGRYTDDYAYDNAVDFNIGKKLNLLAMVKELIETTSDGIYVTAKQFDDKIVVYQSNYNFEYNEFIFKDGFLS